MHREKIVLDADGLQVNEVVIDEADGILVVPEPLPGGLDGVGVGVDA